jgi:hypothetical protein
MITPPSGTIPAINGFASVVNGYPTFPFVIIDPSTGNPKGGPSSALNNDEADEMNLYSANLYDAPFGPSDLEWLYRKQDVDGASLDSRLRQLAPVSFLNDADGYTRRRMFSTDAWDLNTYSYANDNPAKLNLYDHDFSSNSRWSLFTSASLANMNASPGGVFAGYQNPLMLNPPDTSTTPIRPDVSNPGVFPAGTVDAKRSSYPANTLLPPVQTPSVAHRGRKINLNYPVPISNDPVEPVRQKWVRETYQMFKSILPPQAVDTPEELAALSQYVVNIIDFRDPDCSSTRFVNTDIMVVPADGENPSYVIYADRVPPPSSNCYFHAFDPRIQEAQQRGDVTFFGAMKVKDKDTGNTNAASFLVQHGMEYSPLAINEVLATQYPINAHDAATNPPTTGIASTLKRLAVELTNTLTDDGTVGGATSTSDFTRDDLDGWDMILVPDTSGTFGTGAGVTFATSGRPDPITGDVPPAALATAIGNNLQLIIKKSGSTDTNTNALDPTKFTKTVTAMGVNGPQLIGANNGFFVFGTLFDLPNLAVTFTNAKPQPPDPMGGTPKKVYTNTEQTNLFPAPDVAIPSRFFPPIPKTGATTDTTYWYWVYLRRPANPFDSRPFAEREMVVVDSMRFPIAYNKSMTGQPSADSKSADTSTPGTQVLFSAARLQPYRGGHSLLPNVGQVRPISPPHAYGYSEQTSTPETSSTTKFDFYFGDAQTKMGTVNHSINAATRTPHDKWDSLVFHDRDFQSPAELLLVPGCPPGLFTKQFVYENDPTLTRSFGVNDGNLTSFPSGFVTAGFISTTPRTYPYLVDKFWYTGASVGGQLPIPTKLDGFTGDGWFKILEFVEVPSSANGAIGPVAQGVNFDWLRQDTKPGQLNLNLIIDEEVFFGLVDDQRLNTNPTIPPYVVTQIDGYGYPSWQTLNGAAAFSGAYQMPNHGFVYNGVGPNGSGGFQPQQYQGMKAAFADFLKQRSGGSGYLFGYGSGMTGSGQGTNPFLLNANPITTTWVTNKNLTQTPLAAERPYRSLSYPDINYTIMRPASLPPSLLTTPAATISPPYLYNDTLGKTLTSIAPIGAVAPTNTAFVGDQGVRNPFLADASYWATPTQRFLPLIPPRRLFQIPDVANNITPPSQNSAAAEYDGSTLLGTNQPIVNPISSGINATSNLFLLNQSHWEPNAPNGAGYGNAITVNHYLGAGLAAGGNDNRQHPYFRTELLQKMMNLTTVRTHQFAVWITVGFFEVTQVGSASLGIPDVLNGELGKADGKNIRYRSFFILDRTKAVGFSQTSPQDFRDVVVYRRRIE